MASTIGSEDHGFMVGGFMVGGFMVGGFMLGGFIVGVGEPSCAPDAARSIVPRATGAGP